MFSPDIVESDAFLDMPISSQALYFHLAMNSDDDGFVNPKRIMRLVGVGDDDLKVLLTKRFLLPFESGVVVVKHWLIHNLIRADLYKETLYKKEKSLIGLNDNGAYTELREGISELKVIEPPKWLIARRKEKRTVDVPLSALRIGKDRIGKDRIGKDRIEHTDMDEDKPIKEKKSYGELEHVKLTEEEYSKLLSKLGENSTIELIFELDTYIGSKGEKYKSHYATLLNWAKMKHDKKTK
jgi:hypothetical protein